MEERLFREAMSHFATGVTVITTLVDEEIHGMTANAFMSVSLEPRLVLISIDNKAHTRERIQASGQFAVNILTDKQQALSQAFASKEHHHHIDFDWFECLPVIKDALVTLVCKVYESHKAGDHTLFLGEVTHLKLNEGSPLTYYQGTYTSLHA
ncbi:flavin reductase (DIM6/NTAB) family NADH-FMN oxidoreductase RutF [Pullulanibacillus pueri]|uniref:Flavin oxidoreductase n=1 Tax=Pullulanibacillus pueri TaxID=1437324 RepID=A0A8J3EMJ5_9BACL|nr:flavin reductase family protein [Pullulanibacillus pueri]MBM7682291.1 flavin reductase (DIM6/NTAB) family NADH-FMN oxidoreductase RutF [Pullulanibacillus pueri]GGH80922.1 flavin oxidoreductase [Pullulanibacillus pueri]